MKLKVFILCLISSVSMMAQTNSANSWDFSVLNDVSISKKTRVGVKNTGDKNSLNIGGFGFGFLGTIGAPAEMKTDMSASMEVFFNLFSYGRKYKGGRHQLNIGTGFNWKNYRMTDYNRFDKDRLNVVVTPYPTDADINFSRLRIFSIMFPLQYKYKFHKDFALSGAAILNWNVDGSLKTKYNLNGQKVTEKVGRVKYNAASIDFRLGLHWRALSAYVKYSPCNVLKSAYGPEFNSFSAGIMIGM